MGIVLYTPPLCYNFYMPSQHTQWYKDVRLIEALDKMRLRNEKFMSLCFFCETKSIGIKAISEKLYPVCEDHQNA
jgi:hypothetical protein